MTHKMLSILLMASLLVACAGNAGSSATALPTVVLDENLTPSPRTGNSQSTPVGLNASGVTASGIVVPFREAHLAFVDGGRVTAVNVVLGDRVRAGQVLVAVDDAAAKRAYDQARRNLNEITSQASIAAAEQAVANAQQAVEDAKKKAASLNYKRASDELIRHTEGEITLAKQQVAKAADDYRHYSRLKDGDPRKANAVVALTAAQLHLNSLIAQYNWYTGRPSEIDAAIMQSNLDAAKANLQEAQWYLSALKDGEIPADASGSQLTRLEQARDDLEAAKEKLDGTQLVASFPGQVAAVDVTLGEIASPSQVVVSVVSDVDLLQVETTDLSERDVPKVKVGQTVTVTIQALNQEVTGRVSAISPLADTLGGDVVYKTTIELDERPPGLQAGMSVEVQF
jgi:HlyD family secretion protein